jgi:glycosyltransferase involved in cell wall biosynthesis
VCFPGERFSFEVLLANADVLLVPSVSEVPTTAMAWAMAAGVPVVASAVPATAELLEHKRNGLLIPPGQPTRMAVKLAAMLDQEEYLKRVKEPARGQAYDMFSLTQNVAEHARLYGNLLSPRPLADTVGAPSLNTAATMP